MTTEPSFTVVRAAFLKYARRTVFIRTYYWLQRHRTWLYPTSVVLAVWAIVIGILTPEIDPWRVDSILWRVLIAWFGPLFIAVVMGAVGNEQRKRYCKLTARYLEERNGMEITAAEVLNICKDVLKPGKK